MCCRAGAVENLPVNEIGKRDDGALLEFRHAIGVEELVKVRFDFGKARNVAVEDVPVGGVHGQRNDEYPTMRTRNGARIGVLQGRPVLVSPDD